MNFLLNIFNPKRKIPVPMPIITPRLVLRPVRAGDGWAMHEILTETWDQLRQWMDWAKTEQPEKPEKNELLVRKGFKRFLARKDIWLCAIERDTGRIVSMNGLHRMDWNKGIFEVGYWVTKSAQGKGYATEIANALTRYAFDALDANKVTISYAVGNDASHRVIEKLGFTFDRIKEKGTKTGTGIILDQHWLERTSIDDLPSLDVSWGSQQ